MIAGIYIRVSTSNHGQTTDNQRRELDAYCLRQGWKTVVYDDSGISGAKEDRPALNKLLKDAASGKINVVVVWKIDRLARSVVHLLQVLQQLQSAGVGFVATTQQIDTTTAYGRMVTVFLGAVAEFERELIVERVRAGLNRAKAQGVKIGRPRVAVDVRKALAMRNEGLGYKQIARELGIPRTTLYRTLQAIPQPPAIKTGGRGVPQPCSKKCS